MSYRITAKGKIIESQLPIIDKKTLKKMENKKISDNPLLSRIKDKKISIRAI